MRLFLVSLAALSMAACFSIDFDGAAVRGSGTSATDERALTTFDRIEIAGAFDVDVRVGGSPRAVVTGDDNLVPLVETEVRGRTLHVRSTRNLRPSAGLRVEVTAPALDALAVSGSAAVSASGVRSPAFRASVAGSGELVADGAFGELTCSVSGSGELVLRGSAETVDASVSGSGEVDLLSTPARSVVVTVSGSGNAGVHATERLEARISGSGDVRYRGTPAVESTVSGSGSIRRAG
jgi:hypothetical protein